MKTTRNHSIQLLVAAFSLLAPTLAEAGSATSAPKPNIIFILTDDLGIGDLGVFYQNAREAAGDPTEPWHATPHLDALAQEGIQLRRHYTAAPVCAPARASLLLGVHQGHANVRNNQFDKALADNHTLATVLAEAGYHTAAIGKWGLQGEPEPAAPDWPAHPLHRGFDYYFGYIDHVGGHEHYPKEGIYRGRKEVWENRKEISEDLDGCFTTDLFTARAKKWIIDQQASAKDDPFFLYLAYDTPHAVMEYPAKAYPSGGGLEGGMQWLGTPGHMINTADGAPDSYCHPDYAEALWDHDSDASTPLEPWPEVYKRYASMVRRIDDAVGDLIHLLRDLGIDDNTLVVFTSDNGPSQESYIDEENHPTFFNSFGPHDGIKRDMWEGGLRVGALARWPAGIPAGEVSDHPTAFWDWMPTFAELAGLPAPAVTDGVSLVPTLKNEIGQRDSRLYFEYSHHKNTPEYSEFDDSHRGRLRKQMQVVGIGEYMGVRYAITDPNDPFEIYDVVADPQQTRDLAKDPEYADLGRKMLETSVRVRRPNPTAERPYDAVPLASVDAAKSTGEVSWRMYEGSYPWVGTFGRWIPSATGVQSGFELSMLNDNTDAAVQFRGYIEVPETGAYRFSLSTDTGALLRIHEATVIDADFEYASGEMREGIVRLQRGKHPFQLHYLHDSNNEPALKLTWKSAKQ